VAKGFIGESSEVTVRQIGRGTILWRNPMVGSPHAIIDVATSSCFPEYVKRTRDSIVELFGLIDGKFASSLRNAVALFAEGP
jgi:hypothetical protein